MGRIVLGKAYAESVVPNRECRTQPRKQNAELKMERAGMRATNETWPQFGETRCDEEQPSLVFPNRLVRNHPVEGSAMLAVRNSARRAGRPGGGSITQGYVAETSARPEITVLHLAYRAIHTYHEWRQYPFAGPFPVGSLAGLGQARSRLSGPTHRAVGY